METITLQVQAGTAQKIETIIQAFGNSEQLLEQFLKYHIRKLKREIMRMQADLNKFELKYAMNSATFYEKFENGELGDDKEFMIWSGIYEMQLNCKLKLNRISAS